MLLGQNRCWNKISHLLVILHCLKDVYKRQDRGSIAEFTSVSNIFMDEYMPRANGEFIKIYLHLLRLVNSNNDIADELTTERIADKFNMLESDVIRALNYWAEQNLITLSCNRYVYKRQH